MATDIPTSWSLLLRSIWAMASKETLSSSNLKHNFVKNCCYSLLTKARRFVFLYFTQTVHFKSKDSEFLAEFQSCSVKELRSLRARTVLSVGCRCLE